MGMCDSGTIQQLRGLGHVLSPDARRASEDVKTKAMLEAQRSPTVMASDMAFAKQSRAKQTSVPSSSLPSATKPENFAASNTVTGGIKKSSEEVGEPSL